MSYISDYSDGACEPCRPDPRKALQRLVTRKVDLQTLHREVIEASHHYLSAFGRHGESGQQIRSGIFHQVGALAMELRLLEDKIKELCHEVDKLEEEEIGDGL